MMMYLENKWCQAAVGQAYPADIKRLAMASKVPTAMLHDQPCRRCQTRAKCEPPAISWQKLTGCLSGCSVLGPKPPPPPPPKPVMRPGGALAGAAVDTPVTLAAMPAACEKT
jgi:hypothetical protein